MLYRASEHNFVSSTFHQKCDNIQHTLVLARTEYGKTIGGYTPIMWNAASSAYANDNNQSSFLFSVDLKDKYALTSSANAIFCHNGYGPTFGDGQDFYLPNGVSFGTFNFPSRYNGNDKVQKNTDGYKAFTGSSSASCKVSEYEVYQVHF